ncbi:hypothetical protein QQP08_027173 [Theobroma cacao]|nr:hypothetical protein QQP08_026232 [Theobroma cacao]WRX34686.1 hypothetical protein QQP08_027173 [Theobroma cacao]
MITSHCPDAWCCAVSGMVTHALPAAEHLKASIGWFASKVIPFGTSIKNWSSYNVIAKSGETVLIFADNLHL